MSQRPVPPAKVFFIIRAAMVTGVVAFLAGLWYVRGRGQVAAMPPASAATLTTVMYASVAMAAAAVMALRLRIASVSPVAQRSLAVVSWAVGEFAALFGGVVFFLTGEWARALPGALVFALALAAVPLPRD